MIRYDLPSYIVDITPFIPLLTDGAPHTFILNVLGMGDNFTTTQNWFIDAALFLKLDQSGKPTTGTINAYNAPEVKSVFFERGINTHHDHFRYLRLMSRIA
jgi:hypothetical protein